MTSRVMHPGLIGALLGLALLMGCGPDHAALQESYDHGYAAGLAAAQAQQPQMSGDCRDCYDLGFSEGYQQGVLDGKAAS